MKLRNEEINVKKIIVRSYEYMKIIYVNCRDKNYVKVDHRSYRRNLCSCEKKAWKNKKKKKENEKEKKSVSAAGVNTAVIIKP